MHDLFYLKCTTSLVCFLSGKKMHDTELLMDRSAFIQLCYEDT